MAEERRISMAGVIREALEEALDAAPAGRLAEERATYVAVQTRQEEAAEMKRTIISLPDDLHERVRTEGSVRGISMAAYIRDALEERTLRRRPKPRFGAFASGYTDTARLAGDMQLEPRSWR